MIVRSFVKWQVTELRMKIYEKMKVIMLEIKSYIEEIYSQAVLWRRHFHKYPELSNKEKKTSDLVAKHLQSLGLEVNTGVGGYGVTGLLKGSAPGPTIAFRADLDALPIQDEKDCEYRSTVPGVMHACGHDGHTAVLMSVATILAKLTHLLQGNILFIFQPAEELPPGGAQRMIEQGVLQGVEAIYGMHLWTPIPRGMVGYSDGEALAASDGFEIEIIGKGGHGGIPNEATDAVMIAAHLIVNLQSIVSRQLNPLHPGVVTVGEIQGGHAFNVIAGTCKIKGTTRSFDPQVRQELLTQVEKITTATCQMFDASYRLEVHRGYPALINHKEQSEIVKRLAQDVVGENHVLRMEPIMGSEDFAYYLQQIPGAFFFVGAGNERKQIVAPHHHPAFDIDETAMTIAIECYLKIALEHITVMKQRKGLYDSENVSLSDWLS